MSSFLQQYQRQAKLYIDLPSKGVFYNESIIEDNQVTSMPVFGMNAMDEITFKTPDALFTGVATSTVMNSCIPHIKDPWNLVGYDIDYILIAIRIATYGDTMPISTRCPHCSEQNDSEILLTKLLENFAHCNITSSFNISDLKINMAPLTYRQTTDFSMENFQIERKMLQIGNDENISKDDKETLLQGVFVESSDLNLRLAVSYIESIENENDKEEDQANILEFIKNNDAEFYTKLREGITKLTDDWNLPNIDVLCGNDECNKEFKTSLNLDYSNFSDLAPYTLESDIILRSKELEVEIKQIKDTLYRIGWYMRGSFSYENLMYHTSIEDREILNKIIKDNIETTEKTRMPLI